jgi:hypothetical protein
MIARWPRTCYYCIDVAEASGGGAGVADGKVVVIVGIMIDGECEMGSGGSWLRLKDVTAVGAYQQQCSNACL